MEILSRRMIAIGRRIIKIGKKLRRENKEWLQVLQNWRERNEKEEFRYNYPHINKNSLVLDLGGYHGQWSSDIYSRYRCKIKVFEPNPEFYAKILNRFDANEDIVAYNFGLGQCDQEILLGIDKDSTSAYKLGNKSVSSSLKAITSFFENEKIESVALMKVNIEGGEYDLLEHMIDTGLVKMIDQIQVQFHHFIPNAETRMKKIQERLKKSHNLTYQFPFLWENWKKL